MQSEAQIIRDWLRHPGTKIVAERLKQASKGAMRKYDKCTDKEEMLRIQMTRQIFNNTIPGLIDSLAHEPKKAKFDWRKLLGL